MKNGVLFFGLILLLGMSNIGFAKIDCDGLKKEKCKRLKDVLSKWTNDEISELDFVVLEEKVTKSKENIIEEDADHENKDFQAALQKNTENLNSEDSVDAGLCRFDEESQAVQIDRKVLEFSDFGLTNCLSAGIAGALYSKVEDQWLSQLDEKEAWILKKGMAVKVSLNSAPSKKRTKLEVSSAQMLWMSFATQELLQMVETEARQNPTRAIASVSAEPSSQDASLGSIAKELIVKKTNR